MPAEYSVIQLFTGNPIRTQGYGFIAGSEGAKVWAPHCLSRATLGGASEAPNIWRAASDFEGIGTVWIGDALCVTHLQQLRGDQHLAELRQHMLISAKTAFDLSGDLSPITAHFRLFQDYTDLQPLLNLNRSLPEVRIAANDWQSIQAASYRALARWFPAERAESLPALLQSLFDEKGAVCVVGLPCETARRLDFALALMALLPPPLRFACTFATRTISSRGCFAHFKFLWEDHQQPEPSERLFDYTNGTFAANTEIAPYFMYALQAYREGERAFVEFGERYRQRAIELQRFHLQLFNSDAIKAAYYSILALSQWIEQDRNPSAARQFYLVNKDKSLPEPDLPRMYQEGLRLALKAYTPGTPFDSETISQSATALARPALANAALQWLKSTGVPELPEATFELCRAWWNISEAKSILQDAAWQAIAREAAQSHLQELWKRSDHKRAHQFFNRLYRESHERTGFVLDEQTASNLLQIQERAISQYSGDVGDVLETLRLSAAVRSAAALDALLDANWMRALPQELAIALTSRDDRGNLGRAVRAYFRADAPTVFYKLALVCLKREIFQPLLTEESLTFLLSAPRPSERSLTHFYALSQLTKEHYPEIGYAALNKLADQSSLLRAISKPYWTLTAWLIANEDKRAGPLVRQGIDNAQSTYEFVMQLLSAYEPYRKTKLPQLWKALSSVKPVIQDAEPHERADFALLIGLQDEEWPMVPGAVSSLASGLSTWQEPPNALERALQGAKRLSSLEAWYKRLLTEHPMHESVQANAQRVFGRYMRATAEALRAEKPEIERAAQDASFLLRLAPPRSLFAQWVMDGLGNALSATQDERRRSKVRSTFIKLLKEEGFTEVSDLLLESSLRQQLLPAGLTPGQFLAQLDTTIRTLDRLVLWQDELSKHPEMALRVLKQWFERERTELPVDSQLPIYFEGYDKMLESIRELIKAGQKDGRRPLMRRRGQLNRLRSGEREPNSVFGLLLRWVSRLVPPRNSSEG